MGIRTTTFDDLNPEVDADTTIHFALDKHEYEIDLCDPNAEAMRQALAPFIAAARRARNGNVVSISRKPTTSARQPARVDREQNDAIREWARRHGFKVSERGRISAAVLDAFANQDHKTGAPAANETAPRVDDAPEPTPAPAPQAEFTHAATPEAYRTMLRTWAAANGYNVSSRGLGVPPPVVKKFQNEMKLLPPVDSKAG
jgi:hypothetical protein